MKVSDYSIGAGDESHSILIASCGYERRSSYICRLRIHGPQMFALDYGGSGSSYDANRAHYQAAGWKVIAEDRWHEVLSALDLACKNGVRVLVDISSMPRRVLASIVECIVLSGARLDVTFVYAPGRFEQSFEAAQRSEVLAAEPISRFFSGELRPTSVPIGLVIGLGLEAHRALGVMELLEPASTWIFTTYTADRRYRQAAEEVHRKLLSTFDQDGLFEYDLRSISETYSTLDSLSFGAGLRYRLILAPSGPKVFTLACLLVGSRREPARPAVWRVGNADQSQAADVEEVGDVVAALVSF